MLMINKLGMGKAKKEGKIQKSQMKYLKKADETSMKLLDKYPTTETIEKIHMHHFNLRDKR